MDMKKLKVCFQKACLTKRPLEELLREAKFDDQQIVSALRFCLVDSKCRGCGLPIAENDFAVWTTYWQRMFAPCHAACRDAGMKKEAYDCQSVDADCNDCRHFQRGERIAVGEGAAFEGHCLKYDRPTKALPLFCSGWSCFEHRKQDPEATP
jgi:hypothetical protein